jgi:hypothetical protein
VEPTTLTTTVAVRDALCSLEEQPALIGAALSSVASRGCVAIELSVTVRNERARRVYRGAGFQATGERCALRDSSYLEIEVMRRDVSHGSNRG